MVVQVQGFLEAWIQGSQSVSYTPAGLAYLSPWGALRHTANAALIASVYSQLIQGKTHQTHIASKPSTSKLWI